MPIVDKHNKASIGKITDVLDSAAPTKKSCFFAMIVYAE
jgi:hypothetical protein